MTRDRWQADRDKRAAALAAEAAGMVADSMAVRAAIVKRVQAGEITHEARFDVGQPIMTPARGRSVALTWFRDNEARGLVQNIEAFKANLVVVRNQSDPNRLDFLLPPDLMNQLIVTDPGRRSRRGRYLVVFDGGGAIRLTSRRRATACARQSRDLGIPARVIRYRRDRVLFHEIMSDLVVNDARWLPRATMHPWFNGLEAAS